MKGLIYDVMNQPLYKAILKNILC